MKNVVPIDWSSPIIPSKSIAGIYLGENEYVLQEMLSQYVLDMDKSLYRFNNSPILVLEKRFLGEGGSDYTFFVYDKELTNWRLYFNSPEHMGVESRAFSIIVRNNMVYALKVWNFECVKDGDVPKHVYKGTLSEGIGLNDSIGALLDYTKLYFDSAEEWYYCDEMYGGLEVTGYGVSLEDMPEQKIMALAVISPCCPVVPSKCPNK